VNRALLIHEAIGTAGIAAIVFSVLIAAELLKKYTSLRRELTRKFAHAGAGIGLLAIPSLIDTHWTVLALAMSFIGIMLGSRAIGLLSSVHDVDRGAGGVFWYPLTGWLLYYLVYNLLHVGYVYYAVPVLVLAAADAFGAIVGTSYGRHRYEVMQGHHRSVEGSLAFFVVAFFCVHVPLLLITDIGRAECLLVSLIVALLSAMLETISVYGIDNVLVPFGVLFMLERIDDATVDALVIRLVVVSLCAAIVALATRRKPSTAGGAVALVLALYTSWSLGGAPWLAPLAALVTMFVLYEHLAPVEHVHTKSRYELETVFVALTVPMLLLLASEVSSRDRVLHLAYVAALACNGAVLLYLLPQNQTFRFHRLRRYASARGTLAQRVTPGKLVFALAGASLPALFQPGGLPATGDLALVVLLALGGACTFVIVAMNTRAHETCPHCGCINLRGMYCCADQRLGSTTPERLLTPTFRKAYLLANTIAAAGAAGVVIWLQ
jgi:phytol kinase